MGGLVYWNTRKSWFQLRRGQMRNPCQSLSDSGKAMESRCDACLNWDQPSRFRRVCPLLVETPDGLRCSVDAADVRPFWGRAAAAYGGALGVLYLIGVIVAFLFLRGVGYPVSPLHIAWPGLWYRVPQAQGWYYADRAAKAFAAGQTAEGLLFLTNAYEIDPGNYVVGSSLAKNYQLGQPVVSDRYYEQLMRDHPAQRSATANDWYRALLARGNFAKAAQLARDQTVADTAHANFWLRGLLICTRLGGDSAPLASLLADHSPAAQPWRQIVGVESDLRLGRKAEARAALLRPWPTLAPPFTFYYQIETLAALGETASALDLLESKRGVLGDEVYLALHFDVLAAGGYRGQLTRDFDALLRQPLNLPIAKTLCAHLIRWPDAVLFAKFSDRFNAARLPFNNDSAGVWLAMFCTAGAVGDGNRMHGIALGIKQATQSPYRTLDAAETFFRGTSAAQRATTILPALPLPDDVVYAMLDRYPGPRITLPAPTKKP